ncbi:hypothetical protein PENTCL1PPCAC_916, partial [Pristionchus entomophagus]
RYQYPGPVINREERIKRIVGRCPDTTKSIMTIGLLSLLIFPVASAVSNFPIVQTSYGAVRGYEYRAKNGFVAEIFKKIPYASPPTGERRWKKPVPPQPWNNTHDGTFFGPGCAQVNSIWSGFITGLSEDCLTMNVYAPKECRKANSSCPVVVYIHGGSALFSGVTNFPDESLTTNLVSQGVIFVTFAYRLGVFGAMALGDENALPANLDMHDIMESLRFVQKEIHNFGGDKDQVTIMGHSTGASIVLCLVFSPAFNKPGETPLFNRAIGMSSTMNLESEEKQVDRSHAVAKQLRCTGTAHEIIECLRPLNSSEILEAAMVVGTSDLWGPYHISGIALAGELMPIPNMMELRDQQPAHMAQLASSVSTKLMMGTIVNEFAAPVYGKAQGELKTMYNQSERTEMTTMNQVCDVIGVRNAEECAQKYNSDVESGKFDPGYDTLSQALFTTTAMFGGTQVRAGGEVYLYQMDYPKHSSHGDDLGYVLGNRYYELDENEQWISRVYPVYFTNFIRGLPLAPDWKPFNPELMNYYSINKSFTDGVSPKMKLGYHHDLVEYYEGMIKFDQQVTNLKKKVLNAPIQMRNLSTELVDTYSESFNLRDLLFYAAILSVVLYFFFQLYQCCLNRRSEESSPLVR